MITGRNKMQSFQKLWAPHRKKIWHHGTSWGEHLLTATYLKSFFWGLQLESPEVTDLASLVTPDGMRGKG